eukprot:g1933.t1
METPSMDAPPSVDAPKSEAIPVQNLTTEDQTKEQQKRIIPVARVKKIMKIHRENTRLTEDSVMLMTVATELFIQELTKTSCEQAVAANESPVSYDQLARSVQSDSKLSFLQGSIMTAEELN